MTFTEYQQNDALGLAALVKSKAVSPLELLEIAIKRIEATNPELNYVVQELYDVGRAMTKEVSKDAIFAGVPFLIKDLGIHLKGTHQRNGSHSLKNFISPVDSYITERLRKAGFTFLGKTATPEFGLTPYTEPLASGICRNPWSKNHTPGGSSGGSGTAVAIGAVPIATASDGGGSIRIPASCCGLFGMKPSRGRISLGPVGGEMWSGAVVEGCVSRSVRDSAAYLDALAGNGVGELYPIQSPERPYELEVRTQPKQLKIGFHTTHILDQEVHPECKKAVEKTAKILEDLGHIVEEVPSPYRKTDITEVFMTMTFGETSAGLKGIEDLLGRKLKKGEVQLETEMLGLLGEAYTAKDFAYQKMRWNDIARRMGAFHQQYDLLLCPTLGKTPLKIGELASTPTEIRLMKFIKLFGLKKLLKTSVNDLAEKVFGFIPFTAIANMTGQPAMSLPMHWSADGLPIGVMMTGRIGEEGLMFQLAGQMEAHFEKRTLAY